MDYAIIVNELACSIAPWILKVSHKDCSLQQASLNPISIVKLPQNTPWSAEGRWRVFNVLLDTLLVDNRVDDRATAKLELPTLTAAYNLLYGGSGDTILPAEMNEELLNKVESAVNEQHISG